MPPARVLQETQHKAQDQQADSLLMMENPESNLTFSNLAARAALDSFPVTNHLQKELATWQAVRDQIPLHDVLYFFTHGVAQLDQPLQSGLSLSDRRLTLADLFDLRLTRARMAVLAACETGIPFDLHSIDESISLPSGLIQAGVPGVVGSLWSVPEELTALLMVLFFVLWRKKGCPPAEALRQAQILLRDMQSGELTRFLKQDIPAELGLLMPTDVADALYTHAALQSDFSHPIFWSAFFYTGV